MTVTVYSKPGCGPCAATHRALDKKGVTYTSVNVAAEENADAHAFAISLGHQQSPVVVVTRDGEVVDHWSGFLLNKIEEVAGL